MNFLQDISKWHKDWETVIVVMHFNKDIQIRWIKQVFKQEGLVEALTSGLALLEMAMHNLDEHQLMVFSFLDI